MSEKLRRWQPSSANCLSELIYRFAPHCEGDDIVIEPLCEPRQVDHWVRQALTTRTAMNATPRLGATLCQ